VKGAVNLSLRLGIPALIVSLTIVAFGTSAPELLISVKSILDGVPGLALGNVVGSNTAKRAAGPRRSRRDLGAAYAASDTRRTYVMISGTLLFIALAFLGPFTWWHGLILLSVLGYVLFDAARAARAHGRRPTARSRPKTWTKPIPTCRGGASVLYPRPRADRPAARRGPAGGQLHRHRDRLWRQRNGHRPDAGGRRDVPAGTGDDRHGRDPQACRCGAWQRDRVEHVQPARDHRHLLAGGADPGGAGFLRFDIWVMLAASLVLAPFVFLRWSMGWIVGIVFTALYLGYIAMLLADRGRRMTALVTGAAKRLGRAMALRLAERGHDVAVHYAGSAEAAQATVAENPRDGRTARGGAGRPDCRGGDAGLLPRAAEALGRPITVLVNNASIFEYDNIETATRESWDRHLESNLRAPFVLTRRSPRRCPEARPDENGEPQAQGLIVNMIDQRVRKLTPEFMTYTIAKMGLWALTRTSAQALAPHVGSTPSDRARRCRAPASPPSISPGSGRPRSWGAAPTPRGSARRWTICCRRGRDGPVDLRRWRSAPRLARRLPDARCAEPGALCRQGAQPEGAGVELCQAHGHSPRIARMIRETASMMFLTTRTETEALLLEQNLIKQLKPRTTCCCATTRASPTSSSAARASFPQIKKHRGAKKEKGAISAPSPAPAR
jgi:NAD(P)-dependent dehydrogenase (short-subunit alcohol dehydrogenase family)